MTTEMNIVPEIFSVRCVYISNSMRVCLRDDSEIESEHEEVNGEADEKVEKGE